MPCCGKSSGAARSFTINPRMHSSQSGSKTSGIPFEYVGKTGLTAVGAFTRRTYVFGSPGAKVSADARDVASLAAIPLLRQLR